MTHNDDFIERLENYLDEYEGITPLPDAVRHAVRAELPRTKQVGPIGGLTRFLNMTLQLPTSARYGLAAAAVLAAVVLGANFLGGGASTGGPDGSPSEPASPPPSSTARPANTASPAPTGPMSLLDSPSDRDLPSGDYYLDHEAYPARIDFEMPAGWWYFWGNAARSPSTVHALLVNSLDTGARDGSAWGISFTLAGEVWVDPCDESAGIMDSSVTESAEALATAFSSWDAYPATSEEDVTLGGYSGRRIEITLADDAACSTGVLFTTPTGYQFSPQFSTLAPIVNQFTLLDVEGSVLVVWTTDFAATTAFEQAGGAAANRDAHVEDQVAMHRILDSIVITPR